MYSRRALELVQIGGYRVPALRLLMMLRGELHPVFAVTVVIGRRITSWPFSRLDVSREFLRVRGFGRKERRAACGNVTLVTCKRTRAGRS
jgi:hypothetical protein